MRASSGRAAAIGAFVLCTGACYHTGAPRNWLPEPGRAQQEAWGAWIRVDMARQPDQQEPPASVSGELIDASTDSLHVLNASGLASIATGAIASATLSTDESHWKWIAAWTAIGAFSTPSHGVWMVFSVPAWIITGTVAGSAASYGPEVKSTDAGVLRRYARFPQGIPAGLDRSLLRMKEAR